MSDSGYSEINWVRKNPNQNGGRNIKVWLGEMKIMIINEILKLNVKHELIIWA